MGGRVGRDKEKVLLIQRLLYSPKAGKITRKMIYLHTGKGRGEGITTIIQLNYSTCLESLMHFMVNGTTFTMVRFHYAVRHLRFIFL